MTKAVVPVGIGSVQETEQTTKPLHVSSFVECWFHELGKNQMRKERSLEIANHRTEWVNECRTCVEWAALVFSYRRRRGGVGSVAPGKLRYE